MDKHIYDRRSTAIHTYIYSWLQLPVYLQDVQLDAFTMLDLVLECVRWRLAWPASLSTRLHHVRTAT